MWMGRIECIIILGMKGISIDQAPQDIIVLSSNGFFDAVLSVYLEGEVINTMVPPGVIDDRDGSFFPGLEGGHLPLYIAMSPNFKGYLAITP